MSSDDAFPAAAIDVELSQLTPSAQWRRHAAEVGSSLSTHDRDSESVSVKSID